MPLNVQSFLVICVTVLLNCMQLMKDIKFRSNNVPFYFFDARRLIHKTFKFSNIDMLPKSSSYHKSQHLKTALHGMYITLTVIHFKSGVEDPRYTRKSSIVDLTSLAGIVLRPSLLWAVYR